MIIIEEAKRLMCSGCGSMLGVIVSDIKELERETDGQKIMRKYFTCPLCKHNNFLADEDMPTRNAKFMSDINTYLGKSDGFEED